MYFIKKPFTRPLSPVHLPWHFVALVHTAHHLSYSQKRQTQLVCQIYVCSAQGRRIRKGPYQQQQIHLQMLPLRETPFLLPPPKPYAWSGKVQCRGWLLFPCKVVEKPQSVLCGANTVLFALPRLLRALKCWSRSASLTMKRSEKWRPKPCSPLVSCLVQGSIQFYFLTEQHVRHLSYVNVRL